MKRVIQYSVALAAAILGHLVATRLFPEWPLVVDLMLIVVIFHALEGNTLAGMIGGLVAGWASDALVGPAFGLFGVVDTIIGYSAAYAVQRIVIQRAAGAALFFALAAIGQQALLLVLSMLVLSSPELPGYHWILIKAVATGIAGAMIFFLRQRLLNRVDVWRRTRRTRIRLDS